MERSQLGEQNATAQLVVLGESYRAGPEMAKRSGKDWAQIARSYAMALRYLEETPPAAPSEDPFAISMPPMGRAGRARAMALPSPVSAPIPEEATGALAQIANGASFGCDEGGAPDVVRLLSSLPALGGVPGVACAVVILASGPLLSVAAFERARDSLEGEARASFERSADDPFTPPGDEFGFAGFVYGRAARLRAVQGGGRFGLLGAGMGWEMGE